MSRVMSNYSVLVNVVIIPYLIATASLLLGHLQCYFDVLVSSVYCLQRLDSIHFLQYWFPYDVVSDLRIGTVHEPIHVIVMLVP